MLRGKTHYTVQKKHFISIILQSLQQLFRFKTLSILFLSFTSKYEYSDLDEIGAIGNNLNKHRIESERENHILDFGFRQVRKKQLLIGP